MNNFDLPVYQITIDDFDEAGIDLISFVSNPAILVKGLAFADENKKLPLELKFNEEQQIVAGAVLIPDLKIYRYDEEFGEYYVVFTKETIKKMVERLNQNPKKDLFNVDHTDKMAPAYLLGSWIIESEEYDKSRMYGFDNLPVGTFFAEVKVTDKDFWEKEVKAKGKYGFSIEGIMGLKLSDFIKRNQEDSKEVELSEEEEQIVSDESFESYTDYPEAATENAKRALKYAEENGWGDCGTNVGKIRANQLANREPISLDTIKRMAAFIRHEQNKDTPYGEGCGKLMWDAWGGDEGINWAIRKVEQLEKEEMNSQINKPIENNNTKLNEQMENKLKFENYITKDNVTISVDGELAVGNSVSIMNEDNELIQASAGEIILEDGTILTINEEGIIAEIKEAEMPIEEQPEVEMKENEEEPIKEEKMEITAEQIMDMVNPIFNEMREMIAEMQSRIEMLEGNMPAQESEMSKQDFNRMDEIKFKFNNLRNILD